jgi:hypothetical protein
MKGEDKKKQKNEKGVELDYLRFQKSSKNKISTVKIVV